MLDRFPLHIRESERAVILIRYVAQRSHQTKPPFAFQRKKQNEISVLEIYVELVVDGRASSLYVSDVEQPAVGSAGESDAKLRPNCRRRSIASSEIARFAN